MSPGTASVNADIGSGIMYSVQDSGLFFPSRAN
jgi:hypothetical protein